jgi:hypothetical protein
LLFDLDRARLLARFCSPGELREPGSEDRCITLLVDGCDLDVDDSVLAVVEAAATMAWSAVRSLKRKARRERPPHLQTWKKRTSPMKWNPNSTSYFTEPKFDVLLAQDPVHARMLELIVENAIPKMLNS